MSSLNKDDKLSGVVWVSSLETKVNMEVRAIVKKGISTILLERCRRKAITANKTSSFTAGFSIDLDINPSGEVGYINTRTEGYKRLWDSVDDNVARLDAGLYVNPTQLDQLVADFKSERDMLVSYAYPSKLARAYYHVDRRLAYMFDRLPLALKVLLGSPF